MDTGAWCRCMNTAAEAVDERTLQSHEFQALQLIERIRGLREKIARERARAFLDTAPDTLIDAAEWDAKLLVWRQMQAEHRAWILGKDADNLGNIPGTEDTKDAKDTEGVDSFKVPFGPEWELKRAEEELYGLLRNKAAIQS